jgi:hypothetical protein
MNPRVLLSDSIEGGFLFEPSDVIIRPAVPFSSEKCSLGGFRNTRHQQFPLVRRSGASPELE